MSNISSIGLRIGHVVQLLYSGCIAALTTEDAVTHNSRIGRDKVFSEGEVNSRSRSLYDIARPSVVCMSVKLVHSTQAVEVFDNISTAFGTLAIRCNLQKILRRSSQGNPSAGGVKPKRGSQV